MQATGLKHPYHLVCPSILPLGAALSGSLCLGGLVLWFSGWGVPALAGALLMVATAVKWFMDVVEEGTHVGHHTDKAVLGLKVGMILFILSEVLFFFSFFWMFFHSSFSSFSSEWPPVGVTSFDPLAVPLLNTGLLLTSGVTVTWAHYEILEEGGEAQIALGLTIFFGAVFSAVQGLEYWQSSFAMSDGVYGSSFFMMTGFHGLHVLVGAVFLSVMLLRMGAGHFSALHHVGFEASAWYWHFVDVVWLFLYVSVYWWGGW